MEEEPLPASPEEHHAPLPNQPDGEDTEDATAAVDDSLVEGSPEIQPPLSPGDVSSAGFESPRDVDSDDAHLPLLGKMETHKHIAVISGLRDMIRDVRMQPYLEEFEAEVEPHMLEIGSMTYEEAERQEKWLQQQRLNIAQELTELDMRRQRVIMAAEKNSQKVVDAHIAKARVEQRRVRLQNKEQLAVRMHELQRDFRVSETKLAATVRGHHGHLLTDVDMESLKRVRDGDLLVPTVRARTWRVEWEHTPQPLKISFLLLRALKDKVPRGQYVLRCSMYDKLGGKPFRWGSTYRACATQPVPHAGHSYNIDMFVEQNVYCSAPAPADLRPSMIFVFQLYLLSSADRHVDQVVGWGALPLSNSRFEVLQGKFKVPLMRGDIDPFITRFERFETLYKKDLDNWLCNMYLEITHLSRYHKGQREYLVELMYRSRFLDMLEADDIDASIDAAARRAAQLAQEARKRKEAMLLPFSAPAGPTQSGSQPTLPAPEERPSPPSSPRERDGQAQRRQSEVIPARPTIVSPLPLHAALQGRRDSRDEDDDGRPLLLNTLASPRPQPTARRQAAAKQRAQILSEPGVTFRVHDAHDTDPGVGADAHYAEKRPRGLFPADELLKYCFSVSVEQKNVKRAEQESYISTEAQKKMKYITQEMVKELHPRQWRHVGYWMTIFLILVICYARQFTHGIGQSLYLQVLRVPIREVITTPWGISHIYRADLIAVGVEIGMTLAGIAINIGIACLLIIVSALAQALLGIFPDVGSRFIFAWCLATVLDPLITFVIDAATLNIYYGDAFRLYRYFEGTEGNGAVGVFLTFFLDALVIMVSSFLLYMYCYKLHMNGRLLDVYHRLQGTEEKFFIPNDMEMSLRELNRIMDNSRRWRGQGGGSRRVVVMNYNKPTSDNPFPDPSDPPEEKGNCVTHLAILNAGLSGTAELHRHFVRFPDGRFMEVLGNVGTMCTADKRLLEEHLAANKMQIEDFLYIYKSSVLSRNNVIAQAMMLKKLGFMDNTGAMGDGGIRFLEAPSLKSAREAVEKAKMRGEPVLLP